MKALHVSMVVNDFPGAGGIQCHVALAGKAGGWPIAGRSAVQYVWQDLLFAICVHYRAVTRHFSCCAIYLKINHDPLGCRNFRVN